MRHFFRFAFLIFLFSFAGHPAPALAVTGDDLAPGMPCTVDKAVTISANPSGIGGYVLTCENNVWVATMTAASPTQPGQIATKSYIDNKFGTLTNDKWCRTNGTQVICDQNSPSGSLPSCTQGQTIVMGADGWECGSGTSPETCWQPFSGPDISDLYLPPTILSDDGATIAYASDDALYVSSDSGATWKTYAGTDWRGIASSADGMKLVAIREGEKIYTSTNGGTSWTARGTDNNWSSVASSADGTRLVATASGGQIHVSTNSGTSWTARESGRNWVSVASSANGMKLVAAAYGGRIYTSTNGGTDWTARASVREWLSVTSSSDGNIIYATEIINPSTGEVRIHRSTDSGANWTELSHPGLDLLMGGVSVSADGTKLVGASIDVNTFYTTLYKSGNSGTTWTQESNPKQLMYVAMNKNADKFLAVGLNYPLTIPYTGTGCISF